jgi:capsular exopolysaccharide synthesis family protein
MNDATFDGEWDEPRRPAGGSKPSGSKGEADPGTQRGESQRPNAGGPRGGDWRRTRGGGIDPDGELPVIKPEPGRQLSTRRDYPLDAYGPGLAYGEPQSGEFKIDLRKYLWLLFKHRWLILGSAAVFIGLGMLVTFLTTPIYRASTTIQISRQADKVVKMDDTEPENFGRDMEFYQTQYELLKSRSLAERVVAKLGLQDDQTFLNADAPSAFTKVKRLFFGTRTQAVTNDVAARQKGAANRILANLTIEPIRSSSIVKLSFDSPSAELAKTVVNAIADNYISSNLDRRFDSTNYARTFLEERLQQLKVKLEESEKELVAYAEKQQIVGSGDSQNLAMTNLTAANDALTKASADRLRTELLWQQVEQATGIGIPQFLENESIKEMRSKRSELSAEYKDKLAFFKPAFPEMQKLQAQISEIDRQINQEVQLIKTSVKAQYDASVEEEKSLTDRVEQLKEEVTKFRNKNIQYTILQREVDTNRSLYEGLLQRYKEIGVAGGVGTNNVSIVDRAETPTAAYSPRLSRNLGISLVLGLLLGGAAAFAREHLDDTFKSPEDVEESLGLPLLGIIPLARDSADPNELIADRNSHTAEAFRSLRTALQFSTSSGVPKTLLVTSSRPSEGKSTNAAALARNFAELGQKVLLIDGDLRKPSLHRYFGGAQEAGLSNYLAGRVKPPDAFRKTDLPTLLFMGSGPPPPNPAELLAGPKMLSLLSIASEHFDIVIIDGPPVGGLADAPLLASIAAGTLLVIDASGTRKALAKAALKRLYFARAQMVGVVLNKLDVTKSGYHYGYGYGYGYGDYGYYGVKDAAAEKIADGRASKGG